MQLIYMQNKHCLSAITWPLVSPTTQSNCLQVHLGHDAICEGLGRGEVCHPVVFRAFRRDAISHRLKSAFGKWDFTSPTGSSRPSASRPADAPGRRQPGRYVLLGRDIFHVQRQTIQSRSCQSPGASSTSVRPDGTPPLQHAKRLGQTSTRPRDAT
jgi:hypothetical protein